LRAIGVTSLIDVQIEEPGETFDSYRLARLTESRAPGRSASGYARVMRGAGKLVVVQNKFLAQTFEF